jgi:DNA-directed RNA polymerase specialized sigma24 family protein
LDDEMRVIVLSKLDGYTNVEIAARIERSVPTIERRLRLLRERWQQEGCVCLTD